MFEENVIRLEAARIHGFRGQTRSDRSTKLRHECDMTSCCPQRRRMTAVRRTISHRAVPCDGPLSAAAAAAAAASVCLTPSWRYSTATSTHISILCVTLVAHSSNLCTGKLLGLSNYSAAVRSRFTQQHAMQTDPYPV